MGGVILRFLLENLHAGRVAGVQRRCNLHPQASIVIDFSSGDTTVIASPPPRFADDVAPPQQRKFPGQTRKVVEQAFEFMELAEIEYIGCGTECTTVSTVLLHDGNQKSFDEIKLDAARARERDERAAREAATAYRRSLRISEEARLAALVTGRAEEILVAFVRKNFNTWAVECARIRQGMDPLVISDNECVASLMAVGEFPRFDRLLVSKYGIPSRDVAAIVIQRMKEFGAAEIGAQGRTLDEFAMGILENIGHGWGQKLDIIMLAWERGGRDNGASVGPLELKLALERAVSLRRADSERLQLEAYEKALLQKEQVAFGPLDEMTGDELERALERAFLQRGYETERVGTTGDQGADLIVTKNGLRTVVQAKRYSQPVGNFAVQEVVAARAHYGADRAMVICTSRFTPSAVELARTNGVHLIDREALILWLD